MMKSFRSVLLSLALLLFAVPVLAATVTVTGVRIGVHPDRTRVVLDISEPVTSTIFALADPYRVIVDLPEMTWKASSSSFAARGGFIAGLRFGLFKPGKSRLVLDASGPVKVSRSFIVPPGNGRGYRFVVDLVKSDEKAFLAWVQSGSRQAKARADKTAKPGPKAKPRNAKSAKLKPDRKKKRRLIVLDPGHGGVDPGTIALGGRFEKHVVFKFATAIRDLLRRRAGYTAIVTRQKDSFLSLAGRVRRAHEAKADLFISIHADSIADRQTRGGAVYTLSERGSDAEADALAAKENKSDLIAGIVLENHDSEVVEILIDLAQRETMNYAVQFANVLVSELRRNKVPLRPKPHRFAAFRVLKAPDVPSVLLELGYLTNAKDERYLLSKQAKSAVARAIVKAVDRYFAEHDG